jgi:prepilin-type N-terminal cleavage/methylation domain-containing protein
MKCSPSKNNRLNQKRRQAFTLIEMIGVLAVIAILAALLVPKVFSAINDARVNGLCVTCQTLKTAVADHYGKYGRLDAQFGTNDLFAGGTGIHTGYDRDLVTEGLLDKPFTAKIAGGEPSTNAVLQLVKGTGSGIIGHGATGYRLDGTTNNATFNATFVVEAVVSNVSLADAKDLNDRLDGPALGSASPPDSLGRVEYDAPVNGLTTVYIYLTHR